MAGKPQGPEEMDTTINFRIPTGLKAAAEKAARADRRTLAQWLRVIIEREITKEHS